MPPMLIQRSNQWRRPVIFGSLKFHCFKEDSFTLLSTLVWGFRVAVLSDSTARQAVLLSTIHLTRPISGFYRTPISLQ